MAIYDKDGNAVLASYDKDGTLLLQAYDINGNLIPLQYTELKVMTYNVGQWYIGTTSRVPVAKKSEYYAIQNEAFSANRPNVAMLQEALSTWCDDGSPSSELLDPYFDYIEGSRNTTNYQGHYICTDNYPMSNYTVHNFTGGSFGDCPAFETADIMVGGKTIYLLNTHHNLNDANAIKQTEQVLEAVSDKEYFIICGDLNTGVEQVGDYEYNTFLKPFVDAGYRLSNCGFAWFYTYYATASPVGERYRTDNIITSSNILIKNVYVDTTKLTDNTGDKIDHIPLIAELLII